MRSMTNIPASGPTFLCDEMLGGLARWLRAAGYDTATAQPGSPDRLLVAQAERERRLLLTRDRRILELRGAWRHVLVLRGHSADAWAEEMRQRLCVTWWHAPFSRCLLCNTPLVNLPPLPGQRGSTSCPTCRKVYWPGSHTRRMAARLQEWRGGL